MTARNKATSYLFGLVSWLNHDCEKAYARFTSIRGTGMKASAVRDIKVGKEITLFYTGGYFGKGNRKCLYKTCEVRCQNGWVLEDRIGFHPSPEASLKYESQ
jgi:histone-lysine N-methyltransferase SUV420H